MAPSEQGDLKTKIPKNQKNNMLTGSCQPEAGVFLETCCFLFVCWFWTPAL